MRVEKLVFRHPRVGLYTPTAPPTCRQAIGVVLVGTMGDAYLESQIPLYVTTNTFEK